jgi:hypothetical protein
MLVVTLPSVHDGLRVLLMAVLWTFRRLSMGRPAHRQLTRNALLDLTTIIPATTCHQRNYVEAYSRCMVKIFKLIMFIQLAANRCPRPTLNLTLIWLILDANRRRRGRGETRHGLEKPAGVCQRVC